MSQDYNVFISWSGERSRIVAQKLREWLPRVVQSAKPWMSEADIEKGSRGLNELTKALSATTVGITCLTPENLDTAWILFEAGALSKAIDDSNRLCTYLLDDLKPEDIKPPLGMFQATRANKEDTRRLVRTVNLSVSNTPVREDDLDEVFDAMWPSLEAAIRALPLVDQTKKVKRDPAEMIAEILEIVRAEANRKNPEPKRSLPMVGISPMQVGAIIERVRSKHKFLAELIGQASHWGLVDGVITLYFVKEKRPFAELVMVKDTLGKLKSAAEIVGEPVGIKASVED
jgi:hypothetical protein